jgi:hypothetical protein
MQKTTSKVTGVFCKHVAVYDSVLFSNDFSKNKNCTNPFVYIFSTVRFDLWFLYHLHRVGHISIIETRVSHFTV